MGEEFRALPIAVAGKKAPATGDGDGHTLEGYAALFATETLIPDLGGDFGEVITRGAFGASLARSTPQLMFEHGFHPSIGNLPIGKINILEEDDRGLYVAALLSDSWMVEPVRTAIKDGAIRGMSIRFTIPEGGEKWTTRPGKPDLRTIGLIDLSELGPVVFPAVGGTSVGVRQEEANPKARQRQLDHDRLVRRGIIRDDGDAHLAEIKARWFEEMGLPHGR